MESRPLHCMFCDDVRNEIGNKMSFMGIYGADLVSTGPLPSLLPKLAIVITMLHDLEDPPEFMQVTVSGPPGTTEIAKFDIKEFPPRASVEGATKANLRLVFQLIPFEIAESGFIEVVVKTERETARAGRIHVSGASADPLANGQPSIAN